MNDLDAVDLSGPEARARRGREVRQRLPRAGLAVWAPAADRPDPVQLLLGEETNRVAELLPLRHERMSASAFAFYRGAAVIFATDAASLPETGLYAQLCGDAHLANFGGHATPERELVFEINDFDETAPGPFEWDLKRLAASFEIAGRSNAYPKQARAATVTAAVVGYCLRMGELAAMGNLEIVGARLRVEDIVAQALTAPSKQTLKRFERNVRKTRSKTRLKALAKLTTVVDGELRFVNDPPVLQRVDDLFGAEHGEELTERIRDAFDGYRESLSPDRRQLFDRYRLVDVARKVVGVGSVGTRCWVALLVGRDASDPLFLQVKEAGASVLEPFVGTGHYQHHGRRVVEGQRLQQAATDMLLGWTRIPGGDGQMHDYYIRQLWDQKGTPLLDEFDPATMEIYAGMCGASLARAHARSGDPIAISAYLGGGRTAAAALIQFAMAYADQNEADHARFVEHVQRANLTS